MRKTGIALIVLILLLVLGCAAAAAETLSGKTGQVKWKLDDEGCLTISGTGQMGNFSKDDVKSEWKPYNDRIRTVKIKKGVTSIGQSAFRGCSNLTEVSIAAGVEKIDIKAFSNCTSLRNVVIPKGVTVIGADAFAGCTNMVSMTIPASVTKIGSNAFRDCGGLDEFAAITTKTRFEQFYRGGDFCLKVKKGSAAETYAAEHHLSYDNGSGVIPGYKAQLIDKVETAVRESIKDGMNEEKKAKALHDWLIRHAYYGGMAEYPAEGLLVCGHGFCQDYAIAYSLLLMRVDIAHAVVYGETKKESHAWNLVRMDGKWYHVDPTFDDPGTKRSLRSGHERSSYFKLTDAKIRKDHKWDEDDYSADAGRVRYYYDPAAR